mgnify:CR=1 FL=1
MAINPPQSRTLKNIQLFTILASLWIGGLIGIGFLVAPTLFIYLTDKQVAGMIAGEIFKNANFLNCLMGICLLITGALYFFKDEICGYVVGEVNKHLKAKVSVLTYQGGWGVIPWTAELRAVQHDMKLLCLHLSNMSQVQTMHIDLVAFAY